MFFEVTPGWWNGRHAALSALCSFEREGSNPSSGTTRMWVERKDTHGSEPCAVIGVRVQIPSSAPRL